MASAPTRAPAQSTALAKREEMPSWLAAPLAKFIDNPNFEVLLPSVPVNAELGYGHKVAVSIVQLSADPNEKEVFPVGKRGRGDEQVEVYALAKPGLEKLAEAAGIQVKTVRVDDRKDHDYCEMQAYAAMKGSSGQLIVRSATKAFRMQDVADEAWKNRVSRNEYAKSKNWNTARTEEQLKLDHDAEMLSFKKHLVARVESGAVLRAFRSLLAIKSGLTKQQIERPKVLVRVEFNPDASDPNVQRFLLEQGAASTMSLFGPSPAKQHIGVAEVIAEPESPDPEDAMLGGGPVEEEPLVVAAASDSPASAALPQASLPLADDRDFLSLVADACRAMRYSAEEKNALAVRHGGDFKAMYDELNRIANGGAS